jgi:hypothetical protein
MVCRIVTRCRLSFHLTQALPQIGSLLVVGDQFYGTQVAFGRFVPRADSAQQVSPDGM